MTPNCRTGPVSVPKMTEGSLRTGDGAVLHYQSFGPEKAPAVVFANGIGVQYTGVLHQLSALAERYHVLCWDYRGMGRSTVPDPRSASVRMALHAQDAFALLDHFGVERAVFVGWSMGVQVTLEAIRLAPSRVAGFVSLLGTYGRPFDNAFPRPVAKAVKQSFAFLGRHPRLTQVPFHVAIALPSFAQLVLRRIAFVSRETDPVLFDAIVRSVRGIEKGYYGRCMKELATHDASDVLPTITCPVVVVAGERDYLIPTARAQWMARQIPNARYREVARGTHFSIFEYPELVNSWLLELADEVYGR